MSGFTVIQQLPGFSENLWLKSDGWTNSFISHTCLLTAGEHSGTFVCCCSRASPSQPSSPCELHHRRRREKQTPILPHSVLLKLDAANFLFVNSAPATHMCAAQPRKRRRSLVFSQSVAFSGRTWAESANKRSWSRTLGCEASKPGFTDSRLWVQHRWSYQSPPHPDPPSHPQAPPSPCTSSCGPWTSCAWWGFLQMRGLTCGQSSDRRASALSGKAAKVSNWWRHF